MDAGIFDLDGTLTSLEVCFDGLRQTLNLPAKTAVWEAIVTMPADERRRAEAILEEVEISGARRCTLMPNAREMLATLAKWQIPTAVLTRNCRQAMELALSRNGLHFVATVARGDAEMKPHPDGVEKLARQLGVAPKRCLVVGDFVFDIDAGRNAGAATALYWPREKPLPTFADRADHLIHDLLAVCDIVARSRDGDSARRCG